MSTPAALEILFRRAEYMASAHSLPQLPLDIGAEVAFAGRSNAGKSSAINALCVHTRLAHTSKTPGRTQLINFFALNGRQRLVDLPGYGYAAVPGAVKSQWEETLTGYLETRRSLRGLVMVMDVRHPLTDYDQDLLGWAAASELPVHVLLTKADKMNRGPAQATLLKVQGSLRLAHHAASAQLFSALKRTGLDEARAVIGGWLERPDDPA